MTSRISAVTTVNEDSDDEYDNSSLNLRSFTSDLDEIAKMLEQESEVLLERARRSTGAGGGHQRGSSRSSMIDKSLPSFQTPPSATSTHRSRASGPSVYQTETFPAQQQFAPNHHPLPFTSPDNEDDVPTPMKTPAPLMFSPLFDSVPRYSQTMSESQLRRTGRVGLSKSPPRSSLKDSNRRLSSGVSAGANVDDDREFTTTSTQKESNETIETWKYLLSLMRDTIERQNDRINDLQHENQDLRSHVRSLEQELSYLRHHPSPPPTAPVGPVPTPTRYSTDPTTNHPYRASYPSPPLTTAAFTSPRINLAGPSPYPPQSTESTPGRKFVEELSRLMAVDPIYRDPLARIMDDHFTRVNELRGLRGWDRHY